MDTTHNLYSRRERLAWDPKKRHLPVTLVTGFLGAGKTTLLKYVLSNKHNLKVAAAVNDFAALNVDGQIVRGHKSNDGVVELSNGCLCCSISSQFQSAVWSLLQDADIGKVDYLLIETSGVSDPLATISTLEQDYGKMYRIRLDSVVTVMDTDSLVSRLEDGATAGGVLQSAAADSQLQCADIVLLNKRDLVTSSQLELATRFVHDHVPGARVYSSVKCAVPLNYIMEVDEVKRIETVVSHEVASAAYTIGTGGEMNQVRQKRLKESNRDTKDHIGQDEFTSLVFESSEPLSLAGFQDFLGADFPRGVSRMKGTVWFIENRSTLYSFHMSGRQRYEFTSCASVGESLSGSFSVQLVVIGQGIDTAAIKSQLEACVGTTQQDSQDITQLISADPCFELIEATPDYVDFRVTGVFERGITVSEAASRYGINFNRMNSELVRRVNGTSGPVSLLPVQLPTGTQVIRTAPLRDFSKSWTLTDTIAKKIIDEFYKAVGFCKCGM